jgi:hypothetical protein
VRLENGQLAEHWDVIQDEVTKEGSVSGLPMFGDRFPGWASSPEDPKAATVSPTNSSPSIGRSVMTGYPGVLTSGIRLSFGILSPDRTPNCLALIKHREFNDHPIEVVA